MLSEKYFMVLAACILRNMRPTGLDFITHNTLKTYSWTVSTIKTSMARRTCRSPQTDQLSVPMNTGHPFVALQSETAIKFDFREVRHSHKGIGDNRLLRQQPGIEPHGTMVAVIQVYSSNTPWSLINGFGLSFKIAFSYYPWQPQ